MLTLQHNALPAELQTKRLQTNIYIYIKVQPVTSYREIDWDLSSQGALISLSNQTSCLIVIKGCIEMKKNKRVYNVFDSSACFVDFKLKTYQGVEMRSAYGFTLPEDQNQSQNQLEPTQHADHHLQPSKYIQGLRNNNKWIN